ncbi:hypothetical protein COLO4_22726 [Corchorus olitorius]|uniref:TF-B3 domain-containing protein n=1 Tax=Corchorus olitorius TaxID=93759 RepID=A0A1R3IKB7_9ROSI|nr:hypothetical protein COLO4_22726 [Corchorus olitorius]
MAPPHHKSNGRSMFTNKAPHFFKIILQKTLQDGKLEIPERFIRKYGNDMSSPALLKVPTGQAWKVGLRKRDGKVWLKHGWREFSNHYSLDPGHFLVFRYQGNCNFHVTIMDKTATEIDYSYASKHLKGIPYESESESEDDDCIEIIEEIPPAPSTKFPCPRPRKKMTSTDSQAVHNGVPAMTKKLKAGEENDTSECRKRKDKSAMPCPQPHKKMKFDSPNTSGTRINLKSKASAPVAKGRGAATQKSPEVEVFKSRCLTRAEKTEALKKANGFRSKNPFFKVVMQPSCLSFGGRVVSFQADFCKRYICFPT